MTTQPDTPGLERPYPILYVDDEEANRVVFEATFGAHFEIVTAGSGVEALELMASRPFDVLLTDNRMPRMTGVDLCERVRQLHPHVERLLITAYTDRESVVAAINQGGVSRFLPKPWRFDELLVALREAQSSAHRARLSREIQAAFLNRERAAAIAETRGRALHDLANVASRVQASCEELESLQEELVVQVSGDLAERYREEIRDLRRAVDFLRQLHTGVRGLNRRMDTKPGIHEVEDFLHSTVSLSSTHLPSDGQVQICCPTGLAVVCDPTDLGRILVNLISNAAQAIRHPSGAPGRIRLVASAAGDAVEIRVDDNGPGVPSALAERIFESHFTTRVDQGGSGLGLAISRRLARDNGGTLTLGTSDWGGASFRLRLPGPGAQAKQAS
ncbi:MAG TPA: response regulator [Deltaproteobacteria bacterium]|nr:response regulator [Deltaproteobacteria bacterium]